MLVLICWDLSTLVYFLCLNSCSIFVYIFNIGSLCIPFKYYAFSNAFRDINCQII